VLATADLVRAAADGDRAAWDGLVARFGRLVWAVARAHRLSASDAAEVSQTTWLRLVEHLDRIRDPERVGSWLAATARHECLRVLRSTGRELPTDDELPGGHEQPETDARLLRSERDSALWRAFARLSSRCQTLLRVLMAEPPPAYEEVSAALGMPVGSIGPTRARCLDRLRLEVEAEGI
jgi:RNA polymerase sigma factor (sigma-70 family)